MPSAIFIYPRTGWDSRGLTSLPLSVLYLASYLEHHGVRARIVDQRASPGWRRDLRDAIVESRPAYVGISAMTGLQIAGGIDAAKLVREVSPATPVVWGGVHPTLLPEQTLASPHADVVAMGEGETTALDLARALDREGEPVPTTALDLAGLLGSIGGIAFRQNGAVRRTPSRPFLDLDALPPLRYDLVPMSRYVTTQVAGGSDVRMSTSRGCPHRCTYCYNAPFNRRRWRALSAGRVVDVLADLKGRYGIASFYLGDDNFFADRGRVEEICDLIQARRLDLGLKANCLLNDLAGYEQGFLEKLRRAGFVELYIGVEAASHEILASIGRDLRPEDALEVNRRLPRAGAGINPTYSFMAGFPGETIEDAKATLRLMRRLLMENQQARVSQLHLLALYPGTPLYEKCKAEGGVRLPTTLEEWSGSHWNTIDYPWLTRAHRAFLVRASFFTGFLDGKTLPAYFLNQGLIRLAARAYSRILKLRVAWGFYSVMPEVRLLRLFFARLARGAA